MRTSALVRTRAVLGPSHATTQGDRRRSRTACIGQAGVFLLGRVGVLLVGRVGVLLTAIAAAVAQPPAVGASATLPQQSVDTHAAPPQHSVRERIAALRYPALRFTPLRAESAQVRGVPVYFADDRQLPLVTFYATFEGGAARFPREYLAAATAMPSLLRAGGAAELPPDSVDDRIELLALSMGFGQGGAGASSWVNTLTEHLEEAVSLWTDMLRRPGFDSAQVEQWRGAELERVRRRADNPASLAIGRFNHIMYGDHPVGWETGPGDLTTAAVSPDRLRFVHEAVVCPENMALGVTGDVDRDHALDLLDRMLDGWPSCSGALGDEPTPSIRREPGVFVLHKDTEQSVVVAAHASSVRQSDSPEYFASRVGNSILGASGLSSRMSAVLRTQEGLAYGASSLWTTPRTHDGLVGALTRTKPESTLAAARLLLAALDSMGAAPPSEEEVVLAVEEVANSFVFNFQTPFQVVVRQMAYRSLGLPQDWLERYVEGVSQTTPRAVQRVYRQEVDVSRMTVLLLGDTTRFDGSPSELGPVTKLTPAPDPPSTPSAPRRSPPSATTNEPPRSRPRP